MDNNTKQKPEITVEEFIEKYANTIVSPDTEEKEECLTDLRSVIRGKLVEFKIHIDFKYGFTDAIPIEMIDEFLIENWIE